MTQQGQLGSRFCASYGRISTFALTAHNLAPSGIIPELANNNRLRTDSRAAGAGSAALDARILRGPSHKRRAGGSIRRPSAYDDSTIFTGRGSTSPTPSS